MKTILIPTDFSDNAGDALAYALDLIADTPANIHIIYVADPSLVVHDETGEDTGDLLKGHRESLEGLEVFSKARFGKGASSRISISTELVIGSVAPMIRAQAEIINANLIIMGTQGVNHSYVERKLGTISSTIFNNAPCPVLLVPRAYKFKTIDNLLFATNLNHSDPYELWRATELIKPHIGVVRCLYVVKNDEEKDDQHLAEFAKYMIEHSPSVQTIFSVEVGNTVEATIAEYAETYDVELIIMHRSKHPFWERLLKASHTKKMASWAEVPLLVMNSTD